MKLSASDLIQLEFVEDNDQMPFECNSCGATISSWDLVTPCHPTTGFAEGSGHGGVDGMAIYCALNEPIEIEGTLTSYCGWGGPVKEYFPQLICSGCEKNPFLVEEVNHV